MSKLTKIDRFFNNVKLTADDELFVGVDVHKKSYHVALFLNDAPVIDFVMPAKKNLKFTHFLQISGFQKSGIKMKKCKIIESLCSVLRET